MATNAVITVRKVEPGIISLDIYGDMNWHSENTLMDAYNRACDQGAETILLNFDQLEYMNSAGIGLLITLLVRAHNRDQRVLAYGLNEHYQKIFELSRLDEVIPTYSGQGEVLSVP